ncbi:hypothetical protein DL96DRAFT_495442 [Flagelloscypha sp. PMI_526]|nr:hypothetical protein DL96DRAFT_495442 [Flagelloscypha sp. PMI_526]
MSHWGSGKTVHYSVFAYNRRIPTVSLCNNQSTEPRITLSILRIPSSKLVSERPEEILGQLTNLVSLIFIWIFSLPTSHLPASFKQFRGYRDYHLIIPEESLDRVPFKTAFEIMHLTIGYPEDNSPFFASWIVPNSHPFDICDLYRNDMITTSHKRTFIDTIEQDVVPFFPAYTQSVCSAIT